jgi:hypothetical protein
MASLNFKNPFASGLGKNGQIAAWVVAFAIVVSYGVALYVYKIPKKRNGWYNYRTEGISYTKTYFNTESLCRLFYSISYVADL